MIKKRTVKKDNRKIKSKKVTIDGITFDSTLESVMYTELKKTGLAFDMQVAFEIIPAFTYCGRKIRPMKWTVDYYLPHINTIVETKGLANESFPLRLKMFMFQYQACKGNKEPMVVILKNQKEVKEYVAKLKA